MHCSGIHKFPLPCLVQNDNHHQRKNTSLPALSDELDRGACFLLVRVIMLSHSTLPSESGSSDAVSPPSSCHLVQTLVEMEALVVSLPPLSLRVLERTAGDAGARPSLQAPGVPGLPVGAALKSGPKHPNYFHSSPLTKLGRGGQMRTWSSWPSTSGSHCHLGEGGALCRDTRSGRTPGLLVEAGAPP